LVVDDDIVCCSAMETGLSTLLATVEKTVQSALNALQTATRAISAHTDLLKTAMDVSADYLYSDKCTKHQFIHLLTVTCNE